MIVLSIPPAPSGDNVEVLSWVLVALIVIIVMGAILALRSVRPVLHEILEHVGIVNNTVDRVEDSVNHRHPGAPTLADHAVMTRATVERLEENLVDFDRRNEAIHREIIGDVSSLKAWARRWGDLPPEPSSDGSGGRNRLDVRLGQLEAQEAEKETTDGVEP